MKIAARTRVEKTARSSEAKAAERRPCASDSPAVLSGVGPVRVALLARLGIATLKDLALFSPRQALPFPAPVPVAARARAPNTIVRVHGRVARRSFARFGRRSLLRVALEDETGRVDVLFFNQAWLRERFQVGETVEVLGRTALDGRALTCQKLGTAADPLPAAGELVAEYPALEGLSQALLAELCRRAVAELGDTLADPLPARWLAEHELPALAECARGLHAPRDVAEFQGAARRAALERALTLQSRIAARRAANASRSAAQIGCSDAKERELRARFPFAFTGGQLRVAADLRDDLARHVPMRRLLQGDVGSGKTALGLYASFLCAASGFQSAFMAPTELLAEQHFLGLRATCAAAGLESTLLTGSLGAAERRDALARIASGRADVVFGTHALFSEAVSFRRLALAVIDEQHRFGVEQRQKLAGKGLDVHVLLMTATPIPRTLALTVYGDLDVSVLREKPPGRGTIVTRWVRPEHKAAALERMRTALDAGERLYWVVPRIGEAVDDAGEVPAPKESSAELRFQRLSRSSLGKFGVELVHGRLPAEERAARLERFRRGDARVLVATTVIEVGVDVPEATVIAIECAERLGLAQLHQLRGRVGRSARPSACFLYGKPKAAERLALLEREHDGFKIAEADLAQRGMGELCGLRQAGASDLAADPWPSAEVPLALARELLAAHPELQPEFLRLPAPLDA
ncbi:MAG TPA: ATP-dependent DNA helicase RecG [Planctomycetota bacterium]|nr:ATP-dependent DNA helicase RecG [Planctomycetota bacterium]